MAKRKKKKSVKRVQRKQVRVKVVKGTLVPADVGQKLADKLGETFGW